LFRILFLLPLAWATPAFANICTTVQMAAVMFSEYKPALRKEPFPEFLVDGKPAVSPAEELYIRTWLNAIAGFSRAEAKKIKEMEDDPAAYYGQFIRSPGKVDTLHATDKPGMTDTQMRLQLPAEGQGMWKKLTPPGRLQMAKNLARLYSLGRFEGRFIDEAPEAMATSGFSPLALLGAASKGMACGECRLSAHALAGIVGELGIPPQDLRIAKSEDHAWFEIRTEPNGPFWVVDGTPESGGRVVLPGNTGEYGTAQIFPYFLKANAGTAPSLVRVGEEVIQMHYRLGAFTAEANEILRAHASTLHDVVLELPIEGDLPTLLKNGLPTGDIRRLMLDGETHTADFEFKDWTTKDAELVLEALRQSPIAKRLETLDVGNIEISTEQYNGLSAHFPRMKTFHAGISPLSPLLQSSLLPRLESLDIRFVNESEMNAVLDHLERQPSPTLKELNFGDRFVRVKPATVARIQAFKEAHPLIKVTATFKEGFLPPQ